MPQMNASGWILKGLHYAAILIALPVFPDAAAFGQKFDFIVAAYGNDAWEGRSVKHPFATLDRAQLAVRQSRLKNPQLPCTVLIRGGRYALRNTLAFTADDSGAPALPVTWAAWPGEHPTISGGELIHGWTKNGHQWQVLLPDVRNGKWAFQQLFVNGERRFRPRLPEAGYFYVVSNGPETRDRFTYAEGNLHSEWASEPGLEALVFHTWTTTRMRVSAIEASSRTVTFSAPTLRDFMKFVKGQRFIMENVRAAFHSPGQFYLDTATGVLSYIPTPGETPENTEVIAPRLYTLLSLDKTHDVVFRGLTFEHSNWITPQEGYGYSQADAALGATISAKAAHSCSLQSCVIRHTGEYAIEWTAGSRNNRVIDCKLTDLGAGGIKAGDIPPGMDRDEEVPFTADPATVTGSIEIANNLIAHGGKIHPGAVGIWIGHSPDNRIEHNEILDFTYSGISVGWIWGYKASLATRNIIAHNHVHDIGKNILSDLGGIYTLGPSAGTEIRNNLVHGIHSFDNAGRGIYLDEGSSNIRVFNNVVFDTTHEGIAVSDGHANRIFNNIFALGEQSQIVLGKATDQPAFFFERNIVYLKSGRLIRARFPESTYRFNRNLYWDARGDALLFGTRSLAQWQASGQDVDSIVADPLFINPAQGDFRLRPGSPASRIGFTPIDLRGIGRRGVRRRQDKGRDAGPMRSNVDSRILSSEWR